MNDHQRRSRFEVWYPWGMGVVLVGWFLVDHPEVLQGHIWLFQNYEVGDPGRLVPLRAVISWLLLLGIGYGFGWLTAIEQEALREAHRELFQHPRPWWQSVLGVYGLIFLAMMALFLVS